MDSRAYNINDKIISSGKSFQILNSIYSIYLLADAQPIFDVGEITRPLSKESKINLKQICNDFKNFLKEYPLNFNDDVGSLLQSDTLLKVSGSAGPNHMNAQVSALADAHALVSSDIWLTYKELARNMGREDYITYLEGVIVAHPIKELKPIVSKVVQGKEKGNKNRVVCIQNF